ncbi:MAG: GH39 family glycosyl hydrolase, partial [Planctomycetota bacterium]
MKVKLLMCIALSAAGTACAAGGTEWPCIGKIKPRSAKEIHASNFSIGAETMDRDYTIYENWKKYLGPLGFKKARIQAGWAKTEKQKDLYDWKWLDEIINDMVEQGVEPWVCLCYGNSLYSQGGGVRLGASIPADEEALNAWERFVRAIVSRYKSSVDEWEVWNEPNHGKGATPQMYARFLIRTAEAVHSVQKDAKIVGMALAGVDVKYASQVLRVVAAEGKLDLIDEVTYHPYSRNPDTSYAAVEKFRNAVKEYSRNIGIRQGENGAPSEFRKTKALRNYEWTELSQAKWALRRLLGDLGRDIPSSYFAIMDMKYPDEMNRKGLLKANEDKTVARAKLAYYALQSLASVFDNRLRRIAGYTYEADCTESLSLFGYENTDSGRQVIAVWLDAEIPSDSDEKTRVDFVFEQGDFGEPVYVDLREGRVYEIPEKNWSRQAKNWSFRDV